MSCSTCDGSCQSEGAAERLEVLAAPELRWLFEQLGAAGDRRGDVSLVSGTLDVKVPGSVAERAAASGLVGSRLAAGQRRRVDLAKMAQQIAPLSPGAAAAHVLGRPLAQQARAREAREAAEAAVRGRLAEEWSEAAADEAWATLRRAGWVGRLLGVDLGVIDQAGAVLGALPGPEEEPVDRRLLAHQATGDPHSLDAGSVVGGLVLAVLSATGRVPGDGRPRDAWAAVGVTYDDITGGLSMVGIAPVGWVVPPGVPVTLPPRVLTSCKWSEGGGRALFVTENPSVLGAAAGVPGARVVCTSGTPSDVEVGALARLERAGWRLQVRADFDDAGLRHVAAILASSPGAAAWRMGATDYCKGLDAGGSQTPLRVERLVGTPWEPGLAQVMAESGVAVYEECFIDDLVGDIAAGG